MIRHLILKFLTTVDLASALTWIRGSNLLAITASKEGAESTTYSVVITKTEAVYLNSIAVDSLTLVPTFDADTLEYAVATTDATNTVTATADSGVQISATVNGNAYTLGDAVTWDTGDNTVVITASKSGYTSTSYTVVVTKS